MADEEKDGVVAVEEPKAAPAAEAGPEAGKAQGESAGDSAAPKDDAEKDGDKPPKQGGFQKRIGKLTTKLSTAQAEAEYWRQRALAQKPEPGSETVEKPAGEKPEPNPDQYETQAAYVKAVADWQFDRRLREYKASEQAAVAAEKQQAQQQTYQEKFGATITAGRATFEDFDEVIEALQDPAIPITRELVETLIQSENGAALLYHLAQNPEEAVRIAKLPALAAARELGKLEARIATKEPEAEPEEKVPPAPPVDTAPKPISPIRKPAGSGTPRPDTPESDKLSDEDWLKARNAQVAAQRQRR